MYVQLIYFSLKLSIFALFFFLLSLNLIYLALQPVGLLDQLINLALHLLLVTGRQVQVFNRVLDLVESLLLLFFVDSAFSFILELHLLPELINFVLVLLVDSKFDDLELLFLLILCDADLLLLPPQLSFELLVDRLLVLVKLSLS